MLIRTSILRPVLLPKWEITIQGVALYSPYRGRDTRSIGHYSVPVMPALAITLRTANCVHGHAIQGIGRQVQGLLEGLRTGPGGAVFENGETAVCQIKTPKVPSRSYRGSP